MSDALPPGTEPLPNVSAADPARQAWTGRALSSTGFDGDLGEADPDLRAALEDPRDETALVRAVSAARLLVPIMAIATEVASPEVASPEVAASEVATPEVATPESIDDPGEARVELHALERATDMAVLTLTLPDGQRGFPVFSSVASLSAWDASARPSPVTGSRAAQAAVSERCDVMLLDLGSGHERVLRPSMVWALAQQREWLPAHTDPFVAEALVRATADEEDVVDCVGEEGDPAGAGILRVVLTLRPGLQPADVAALATRVGEAIATDGEARARIDGLSFTIARTLLT